MLTEKVPMSFNKKYNKIVVGTLIAQLLLPTIVSAAESGRADAMQKPAPKCERFAEQGRAFDQRFVNMRTDLFKARESRDARMTERKKDLAEKLAEIRTSQEEKRDELLKKLGASATTDVQKQALATFKAAVSAALKTRHDAIDAANSAFDLGVKDAILKRKVALDAAVKTFADAITAAMTKAKADCAAGVDAATVRATFKESAKAAKEKLKADRAAAEKVGPSIQPLIDARRKAFEKAHEDFKTALEKAKEALRAVFVLPHVLEKKSTKGEEKTDRTDGIDANVPQ